MEAALIMKGALMKMFRNYHLMDPGENDGQQRARVDSESSLSALI